MKPSQLRERRVFDFRILEAMRCQVFDFKAFVTSSDLDGWSREIEDAARAGDASKYRFFLRVPTLVGPGEFSSETAFSVDTDVIDYPDNEPNTWVVSAKTPWSPHFVKGAPVCIGSEFWAARRGHVTLGHLVIHLARLLNWDEKGRGRGYTGYSGEAIEYHRREYGGKPLNPSLPYPVLPSWLSGEGGSSPFRIIR